MYGVESNIWLIIITSSGIFFGVSGSIRQKELQLRITPNQGVWFSGRISIFFMLIFGLIFGLFFGLTFGHEIGLIWGLIFAMIGGLRFGGMSVLEHFVLRSLLAYYNYLPLSLVTFLDDMTNRILLRKIGGGYIFIHRMLLEYFASLKTTQNPNPQS